MRRHERPRFEAVTGCALDPSGGTDRRRQPLGHVWTELRRFRAQPPDALARFGFYVEFAAPVADEAGASMTIKQVVLIKN